MTKQFTKKEIEKRFKALYPNGIINLEQKWYSIDGDYTISIKRYNNYDIAEKLNLASKQEISEMKKLAGYRNY